MKDLELIKNDFFNIAERLKEINPQYALFFNHIADRYEVYVGEMLVFIVPYDELDERTLKFAKWQNTLLGEMV